MTLYGHIVLHVYCLPQGGPGASATGYGNMQIVGPEDIYGNYNPHTWVRNSKNFNLTDLKGRTLGRVGKILISDFTIFAVDSVLLAICALGIL